MSRQAVTWAKKQTAGGAHSKAVLMMLALLADKHGGVQISNRALAAVCEMSPDAVRCHIGELERRGLIARSPCFRPDGGRAENRIVLALDKARRVKRCADAWSAGLDASSAAGTEWGRA